MGFLDRDEHEELRQLDRIADSLEFIARLLAIYLPQTQLATGVTLMAFPTATVAVGDSGTGTGTALDAAGNVVVGNTVTVTSSDDTIVSVTDNGSSAGVDSVTWTAVAAGTATITGSTTNPSDGSVVSSGNNNPLVITVAAAADLATSVSLA